MSIGKNPHRPEGKADFAARNSQRRAENRIPSERAVAESHTAGPERNTGEDWAHAQARRRERGEPLELDDSAQVGGSRPGVHSRVKDALARNENVASTDDEE